jgi:mannose/fructose-specific phosphotransferase system component IIA
MTPLLILTHGDFGGLLLRSAEQMFGPQTDCAALALAPDEPREHYMARVKQAASAWSEAPLAIVDLACGTPWNSALLAGLHPDAEVLAGLSLPLLLEALELRAEMPAKALAEELAKRGAESFTRASALRPDGPGNCA